MSYQPQPMPPMGAMPPVAPYQPVVAPSSGSSGTAAKVIGALLIVAGLVGGGALILLSGSNKEATVKKFARAPVGCTTTLEFDKAGQFTLYVETKGSVPEVDGDCANDGVDYDRGDDDLPTVTLTLVDGDDNEVSLGTADAGSYSAGDYAGQAYRTVSVDEPGSYSLTVTSADTDFAIAVGGDPDGDSAMMMTGGIAAIAAGVLLGVLVLLLGARRRKAPPSAPQWQPAQQWPQQPTVPGYQPQQPGYGAPAQQWPPSAPVPPAPPTPPPGQGWGAPQQ